jgi:hypothetical protein
MSTSFRDFMQEIESEAAAEGEAAVQHLKDLRCYFQQRRYQLVIGDKMSSATYAFVFNGDNDWRKSVADDWDLDVVELDGTEKVVGHRQIDGSICKVLQSADGTLIAITK